MKFVMKFEMRFAIVALLTLLPSASFAADAPDTLERDADLAAKKLESKCDDIKLQRRDDFLNKIIRPLNAKFDARIERNHPLTEEVNWRFKKYRVTVSQPTGASPGEVGYAYSIRDAANTERSFQEVVLASITEPCRSFQTGLDPNAIYALSTPRDSDQMQDDLNRASQVIADFNSMSASTAPSGSSKKRKAHAVGNNPTVAPTGD
jgi:hypothetical protein